METNLNLESDGIISFANGNDLEWW